MKLSARTINNLAEMICGTSGSSYGFAWENFPYRSSSQLTRFFRNCNLAYVHQGETRQPWVEEVIHELNQELATVPQLPADSVIRVIQELMDIADFERQKRDRDKAFSDLNEVLKRDGLEAYFADDQRCHLRHIDSKVSSTIAQIQFRPLSAAELSLRKKIEVFLEAASEDEFIERFLVPLFRQLGFLRVTPTGHKDRKLEYGKDIWMKYRLPTGHFIYFSAQVKKDKIDASGKDVSKNISGILAQVQMSLDHPVFDPEMNRKHLVDHVYIVSAKEITKQARNLLGEKLDQEARRHIIFMDRDELLDLGAMATIDLPDESGDEVEISF